MISFGAVPGVYCFVWVCVCVYLFFLLVGLGFVVVLGSCVFMVLFGLGFCFGFVCVFISVQLWFPAVPQHCKRHSNGALAVTALPR